MHAHTHARHMHTLHVGAVVIDGSLGDQVDASGSVPLTLHTHNFKQQALLAAISEKDANIALLELSSSKRKKTQEEVMALKREKDRLMHQLKQQTQSRMKLIADNYEEDYIHPQHHPHHLHHMHPANLHHRSLPRGDPHANHRPPMDQDDEEGIWA
ncbi:ERC protein 2 [Ameca splendens]|uniref:ERC protein 2 n=1 Tax=Ameca splendens TaxID=208324 RepID=A0ABV0XZQ5_9TELE